MLFVEVYSIDKKCDVIINLESVIEIAPLREGGTALFFADNAGVNSRGSMKVTNDYAEFQQFVMQTVSAEDIARRFPSNKKSEEVPAVLTKSKKSVESDIPTFIKK